MKTRHSSLELALLRRHGRDYWRSLEELAGSEEFARLLQQEFPQHASEWSHSADRREFLKLMGASLALAGLSACTRQPNEAIVPYVRQPEDVVPGRPLFFATATTLAGVASGVLVESHEGRPTKIEGNPDHPASLGATDVFSQASVLSLYDPDRSQTLTHLGNIRPWPALLGAVRAGLDGQVAVQGAGLRLLTETITSPTLAGQIRDVLSAFPKARWHQYDPSGHNGGRAGTGLAFGESLNAVFQLDQAEVILTLDSDFLGCGPASLRYARDFASRRKLPSKQMNRLYAVESTISNTGAVADHRLPLRPAEIEIFARALAHELGVLSGDAPAWPDDPQSPKAQRKSKWIKVVAGELQLHRGSSVIIPGDYQSAQVHALAHAINHALGNIGKTVLYTDPIEAESNNQTESLRELVGDMDAGRVTMLVILAANPVYTAPADLKFAERLQKVGLRIHLSLYEDETSALCHWHIPEAHYLESWSDARAYDGTVTILQPLIAPLYRGKTAHELVAALTDRPERSSYDIVRDYWRTHWPSGVRQEGAAKTRVPSVRDQKPGGREASRGSVETSREPDDFEQSWRRALHDGFIANTRLPSKSVSLRPDWHTSLTPVPRTPASATGLDIVFRPDSTVFDGRFSNNGWLQELPKPLTKLTWDNAALVSLATADRLGLGYEISKRGGEHGEVFADVVELRYRGRMVRAPIWIQPGLPDDSVTVHLGYGRTRAGRIGTGAGFNAYALRTSEAPWFDSGLELRKTGQRLALANTQLHHDLEGRDLIRSTSFEHYRNNPGFAQHVGHGEGLSLYPPYEYQGYAWGMAIDLNSCIGCNACVVACQAENNIPIVGKEEVLRGREMHWLRIDRYYKGPADDPETYFQPVPCMHCENAPCEVVCPVAATVHSAEGLNDMVYNRCVGTRYCSNNCPYKVRRFNFLLYSDWDTPSLKLLSNPDVTVRSRGVMEKCTYCVQRINKAKIEAEKEDRQVRDGEVLTACQAVCPVEAIIFGNINDSGSQVAKLKREPRNYGLLAELNTRPRTTYLAAVRNINPELD
jgi:MoCo/4Fe-4S cofactor protein with predicted Tat translocation signal